jgi:anti-sigma factor RsiW
MNIECSKLDAYLSGELSGQPADQFERHLPQCEPCRHAIDEQRWIDGLLRSPNRLQLDAAPSELIETFQSSLAQRRRRLRLAACGLAAAASLLVAVGWLELNRQAVGRVDPVGSRHRVAESAQVRGVGASEATFVGGAGFIAIPLESPAADVTVVQVFPTVETEMRWRRELALPTSHPNSNGG